LHYQRIDLDRSRRGVAQLPELIDAARTMGFAGLNVTYPVKQAVLTCLDEVAEEARSIGAVNTVVFAADGRATGHNTDASGWRWAFERELPQADLSCVLLLGAGGAGAAIGDVLARLGAGEICVADRDANQARALVAKLQQHHGSVRVRLSRHADTDLRQASGLVHATPTGMAKQPGLPIDAGALHAGLWVSEVVYYPLHTALVQAADAAGCRVMRGGGMAVGQAMGAFQRFTGCAPDAARMQAHFNALVQSAGA
jgi:shikimate dehydrogenase